MDSSQNPGPDKQSKRVVALLIALCLSLMVAMGVGVWWHRRIVQQISHPRVPVGALIKGQWSTVYYLSEDGNRWPVTTNHVFYSWFPDLFWVEGMNDTEPLPMWGSMHQIPLGGNMTIRPGTYIIHDPYDDKLYWVAGDRSLRQILTRADLIVLGGKDWMGATNQPDSVPLIVDMPGVFMQNYGIDTPMLSNQLWCDGMLFRREPTGPVYLIDKGATREVTEEMMRANLFQDRFVRYRPDLPPLPQGPPLIDDSYLRSQLPGKR